MTAPDLSTATYHPHPSYVAMEAAWEPERRRELTDRLARSIDQHTARTGRDTTPAWAGNIATQKRPRN